MKYNTEVDDLEIWVGVVDDHVVYCKRVNDRVDTGVVFYLESAKTKVNFCEVPADCV